MSGHEAIVEAIYRALDAVNETLSAAEGFEKAPTTVLIGESGKMDSLRFVTFITVVEENVERAFDSSISVMDLVDLEAGPFTVAALTASIAKALNGASRR